MATEQDDGVCTQEGGVLLLTELLAAAALTGAKLRLYKTGFRPLPTSKAADFQANEANYTGYAPIALTYSAVGLDGSGIPTVVTNRCFFQATDAVTPNNIAGCWVEYDTTATPPVDTGLMYFAFGQSIPMVGALDYIAISLNLQGPNGAGSAVVDH